ncbi:MAG: phosphoglycolate phosphatase [Chromatiales bacterium]|jgi:phosphoglycolate phosphatase|nr:phosphoglycolate phosphatase [Chromatiales bacterium]
MTKLPTRLILFDLDGTLVDSVPDIAAAVDASCEELGIPVPGETKVRNWVGNGIHKLIERAINDCNRDGSGTEQLVGAAVDAFERHYARTNGVASTTYAGAIHCLDQLRLRGTLLGCVTNKPYAFAQVLLDQQNLSQYFGLVVGGDTLTVQKPDPGPLVFAGAHFAIPMNETVMVGDSSNDVRAARAAGCAAVCVSYGYNHGEDIADSQPDALIDSLADLPVLMTDMHTT